MSNLYLTGVEFSNFRIYGDSYAFDLPAGPGVTLITGGNGLGKTSFFDGVEWALTDQVGRFNDIHTDLRRKPIDPLTRIGAPEKSHRVSLQFSDGTVIDRGGGFEVTEAEIVALLKRPEWAEISNLHGYLSITHFFGQASTQRFSLKKPTDQWEALKGPAGVDRINTLRERMSGPGVKRAFTRAIDDRGAKLKQATVDLTTWTELIQDRSRARQLASSEQAVSPPELRPAADRVAGQILALSDQGQWSSGTFDESSEAVLDALSSLYRVAVDIATADRDGLDYLANLVNAFEASRSESSTLTDQVQAAEARLAPVRDESKLAIERLATASESLRVGELELSQSQSRLVNLARVAFASKQLHDAMSRQASLQLEQSAIEAAQTAATARFDDVQRQHSEAVGERSARRILADQVSLARSRAHISMSIARVGAEISRITELIDDRNAPAIRELQTTLTIESQGAIARIASLNDELRQHDDRSKAITEAVAVIAHRLTHLDTACPVCTTSFPSGQLFELVQRQLAASTTPAQSIATSLAETRSALDAINRQIAETTRDLVDVAQLETSLSAYRAQVDELRQQLVDAGGAADGNYADSDVTELERALEHLDEGLAVRPTPDDLSLLLSEVEATVKAEAAKRISVQGLLATASYEVQAARSELRQHPDLWTPERGLLVDLPAEHAAAEERAGSAGERVAAARSQMVAVQAAHDSLLAAEAREVGAVAAANARLRVVTRELQEVRDRWTVSGQIGEPDPNRLTKFRQTTLDREVALKPLGDAIDRLIAGYRKWLQDEQLRTLEAEISGRVRAMEVESEQACQAQLTQRVQQAARDLQLAQAAKDKVDEVGSRMQEVAKTYAGGVLVPLNATIRRFAKALMTWSDTAVSYTAEHHSSRSALRPNILRSELDGSTSQLDMNPSLYFSEGQLSALSVSALFAASTTFGWSRWRGLLLDDPLQHNDVIHASAFMDLLRQMVLGLGYQIILSTHDSAEAEFLTRKCRSAGIPHRIHELAPRGAGGLVNPYLGRSRVA